MTAKTAVPIYLLSEKTLKAWIKDQPARVKQWTGSNGFTAAPQSMCAIPDENGHLKAILYGVTEKLDIWSLAGLHSKLPMGEYRIATKLDSKTATSLALGYTLSQYQFTRYKKTTKPSPKVHFQTSIDAVWIKRCSEAIFLARNLINTPASDMGPAALASEAKKVAAKENAACREIVGQSLLKQNFASIYTVGKASADAPRLIDFIWGNSKHPKVTLVGKGVCFDSGGLDIKSATGMKMMKKDMGGAAVCLSLASLIMAYKLPVRLRVLLPIVENSISGNAFRPLDVIKTRKGKTVEVGNTDAEGRLILCDALAEADSEKPDLLIDCATLTGAARVALGTDIPVVFSNDDALAQKLVQVGMSEQDPLWQLPLWKPYGEMLKSAVADLNSAPDSGYAGAITAALFLNEFVHPDTRWLHLDMMAWNTSGKPGRPIGGEAMALRALFAFIQQEYKR